MSALFRDRQDAGRQLAERLAGYRGQRPLILAIPRGGVPVGCEIARRLGAPLDLIMPRKLPVPYNPEAGFGAVAPDGTVVLNEEMVRGLGLEPWEIESIAMAVRDEVQRRERAYRQGPPPDPAGGAVIITDDGLATGYTMIAAARMVKKRHPRKVIVAVPVGPRSSVERLRREADEVVCLHEQLCGPFAVASFYGSFPDLSDGEVLACLGNCPLS